MVDIDDYFEITEKNYQDYIPLEIVALFSNPDGVLLVITKDGSKYRMNWGYHFLEEGISNQLNPFLKEHVKYIRGEHPDWYRLYFGLGHHLFIKNVIRNEFQEQSGSYEKRRLFEIWPDIVLTILKDSNRSSIMG